MHLLFVCTGNTCRSPMAAGFAMRELSERGLPWTATSRGLYTSAGQPMSSLARDALTRRHIPLSSHESRPLSVNDVATADYILPMTFAHARDLVSRFPDAKNKIRLLGKYLERNRPLSDAECDIVDPYGGTDEHYEACARDLEQAVRSFVDEVVKERTE